jgi:hypothetical protein
MELYMPTLRELEAKVREVLLNDWDPIGIRDVPTAQDEYDGYVMTIVQMILSGKSLLELCERLLEIEIDAMGLKGDKNRASSVADKLRNLTVQRG